MVAIAPNLTILGIIINVLNLIFEQCYFCMRKNCFYIKKIIFSIDLDNFFPYSKWIYYLDIASDFHIVKPAAGYNSDNPLTTLFTPSPPLLLDERTGQ